MLLTKKYAPKKLSEIIGNDEARSKIQQWILSWLGGTKKKPLLIYGSAGVGKTSVAYALAAELELDLIEMSASELRNRESIERVLVGASLAGSLTGRKKILLVDDVDSMFSEDRGGVAAIASLLKEKSIPVILTATNAWEKKISAIRTESEMIEMKKVSKASVLKILKTIKEKEKLIVEDELLESISEETVGDIRSAINDLQANYIGYRDREKDIFQRIRKLFKAKSYREAKEAVEGDVDRDLIFLWIDHNIPLEYNLEDTCNAYNYISRADVFKGRIRNQHWTYLKYYLDFMSAGVALAKKRVYNSFTKYQFPKYLRDMSSTVATRALRKSIGLKIGSRFHTNSRDALMFLPVLKELFNNKKEDAMALYHLEEAEIAYILEKSVYGL